MKKETKETLVFQDLELSFPVQFSFEKDIVWLNRKDLSMLFYRNIKIIRKYINNL